ncbi:DNA mismatch repair protein MutT [Aerococcus urinaehominis]|uniref:8-oxo-dGTP diphosphatase n=1 Tax=Aerococcus urinaehominis TaxID=128944 RepID=A0A0X8FME2_9LACT|nr:(deoxy)nucleoside triphosphate pyrophosphohydrolase [Aerococcus urinaehominis]AMC00007.1 DNA mismatch repair protein MutT [Aerococcus urinaehominis]SDL82142.1 8-oxo-dGTP diphosphatase [Aerococcus urinaehominis]
MKVINVVGAIMIRDGKILCAQRGPNKSLAYKWEFPGGKIEAGESPQAALERELREELLIDCQVEAEIFDQVSYQYDFGQVNLTTILCYLDDQEPQITEHIQFKWLAPGDLLSLDWPPANMPTIEKLSHQTF